MPWILCRTDYEEDNKLRHALIDMTAELAKKLKMRRELMSNGDSEFLSMSFTCAEVKFGDIELPETPEYPSADLEPLDDTKEWFRIGDSFDANIRFGSTTCVLTREGVGFTILREDQYVATPIISWDNIGNAAVGSIEKLFRPIHEMEEPPGGEK